MRASISARDFGLGVVGHSTDDRDAERLEPLHREQSDAAGSGGPQHGITGLDRIGLLDQILNRHALQHHGRALFEADGLRHLDQHTRRHHPRFRIGAVAATGISDAIACLDVSNPGADRFNHTCTLGAESGRHRGRGVEAGAKVDVDEVQADRMLADPRFTRPGVANRDFFPNQHFRTTVLVYANRLGHALLLV